MIKLSIIIPVYNIEKYLNRCLDSILNQGIDPKLYEIIIINDGSTDNSQLIIDKYTNKYSNIESIYIKNSGVSVARNHGISQAKGKMVIFVDPDDSLYIESLKKVISLDYDSFNIIIAKSFMNNIQMYDWTPKYHDGEEVDAIKTLNQGYVRGSVCGCIFSTDFLTKNQILFPDGIKNSEDTIFLFKCLAYSQKIIFKDINLYSIIGRPISASKTFNKARINSMYQAIEYVNNLILSSNIDYNKNIFGFLKYIIISNLTYAIIKTKEYKVSIAFQILNEINLKILCPLIKYKKKKISIINHNYPLYYLLCSLNSIIHNL